jgi:hypothetical protein
LLVTIVCSIGRAASQRGLFSELKIPRSTVRSWLHRGIPDVVTCEPLSAEKTVVIDLSAARVRARQERMKANRAAACGVCAGDADFGALQLWRAECRMS